MAAYFIAKIARSNSKLKLEDGKVAVLVHDDKVAWAFIRNYWNDIRKKIKDGAVEKGELTWESISSFMTVLDTLGLGDKYSIPDDIIGAFADKTKNDEGDLRITFGIPPHIMRDLRDKYGEDDIVSLRIQDSFHSSLKELWMKTQKELWEHAKETEESFPGAGDDNG